MAKLTKDQLKQKISDNITDNDDLVISLLEDIEDSIDTSSQSILEETARKELEDLQFRYADLKRKYKERFLDSGKKEDEKIEEDDIEEKKEIDIKEI